MKATSIGVLWMFKCNKLSIDGTINEVYRRIINRMSASVTWLLQWWDLLRRILSILLTLEYVGLSCSNFHRMLSIEWDTHITSLDSSFSSITIVKKKCRSLVFILFLLILVMLFYASGLHFILHAILPLGSLELWLSVLVLFGLSLDDDGGGRALRLRLRPVLETVAEALRAG